MYFKDALLKWGKYEGSKKKPKDFSAFWEKGKQEVKKLGLEYELIPHSFTSKVAVAYDLYYLGVNKSRIHAQVIMPKFMKGECPVLFQFHGYHVDAGDWGEKVGLVAEGFIVIALDVRGQGGLSEDNLKTTGDTLKGHIIRGVSQGPEHLFFRQVFLDIYQLTEIIKSMKEVDCEKLYCFGASQGGALALVCAALTPEIKKVFVCYPFLSDYREAYKLDVMNSAYEELAYWFRFKDPLHEKEETFFATLDYIDLQYLVPEIKGQVNWAIGLADTVCPVKTQFAVFNQLNSPKKMYPYPEYGHEYLPKFGDIMRENLLNEK